MNENTVVISYVDENGKKIQITIPDSYFEIKIGKVLRIKRTSYSGVVIGTSGSVNINILDEKAVKVISDWSFTAEQREKEAEFSNWGDL